MTAITSSPVCNGDGKLRQFERNNDQPGNPFSHRVPGQKIAVIPSFTLESGIEMHNVPVAYMSWGKLSIDRSNVMVVCHALSGSADISDWWSPLLGPGKAFDTDKFLVICMNSLGSPYGTASPVTVKNGNLAEGWYGADFPSTTIRDDVRIHRLLLDDLGVQQVAAVIGGSMGGMLALEWAYFGKDYVRCIVPVATSSHQSAWGIGWGEAQRHAIYSDVRYNNGRYSFDDPPVAGLEAARMAALLTYRSRDSLEKRFGRDKSSKKVPAANGNGNGTSSGISRQSNGNTNGMAPHRLNGNHQQKESSRNNGTYAPVQQPADEGPVAFEAADSSFAAQTYLRYQAKKFSNRFDSNCYIALTQKLDSHDISRGRTNTITEALSLIQQPTLVLGIRSDGLYTLSEQELIARCVPNAKLREIMSHDGHDAFLIESHQLNWLILGFLFDNLGDIMQKPAIA